MTKLEIKELKWKMLKAKELILDFYLNFIYLFEPMIGEKLKPTTYQFEYY